MDPRHRRNNETRGPFVPLLLLAVGFMIWTAAQDFQLMEERKALKSAAAQQSGPLAAAQKVRRAADSLAAKTQALANKGNADAQHVVALLKERGVTINPNATAAPVP